MEFTLKTSKMRGAKRFLNSGFVVFTSLTPHRHSKTQNGFAILGYPPTTQKFWFCFI